MSVARQHAEWLSLVESSGPFLSMPVLLRVFPQGLEQRDAAKASQLREAYDDWLERGAKQPAIHHAWIRDVLEKLLEYPPEFLAHGQAIPPGMEATMSNFGETLRPDFVLKHRDAGQKPLLLIEHYPPEQDLEKPVAGKLWKATPGTRMMELLHATEVPLGLVTNGEQWMIVYAPRGETTGFTSWYADLWMQEPITLRAFHSLLHLRRFLGVAEPETLAGLYAASSKDQQEVTDQLGYQVRRAVEMLVQAFDRIDAESGRTLLAGVSEKALYDSALTMMMRLVFLFSADERGLLLLGDPLYDQHYAVSTLSELLRERADQHGEEVLERRHDAWCRLLATFRAVHSGVEHEAMRLPPYGGTLFDPDRYPFLEGRAAATQWQTTPAKPLPINNRVVLHLLEALQLLRVKVPGGGPAEARRLSFRALDIEQIGHVYEGLLDHTAKRARETILGLAGSKNSEPEIPLSKLEELAAKGTDALIEFLAAETGRQPKALRRDLESNGGEIVLPLRPVGGEVPSRGSARGEVGESSAKKPLKRAAAVSIDEHALLIACGQDPLLDRRVKPFAGLLRDDSFDKLVVIPEGSVYVTAGSDRRSTGTHYTPRSLTEPIVQHTLEPLVYIGPAEGKPSAEWKLKSAREILALKVCDMTMGSGAFLVQTCRYLAERLVEAWEIAERELKSGVSENNHPHTDPLPEEREKPTQPHEKLERPGSTSAATDSPSPPSEGGGCRGEVGAPSPTHSRSHPLTFIVLPDGSLSLGNSTERLLPADPAERLAIARRFVADRCLYGVDINPMAVEMAKLSLWLITLQRDRPFTFLDHALKCGDSLLGVSSVQQIENFSLRPGERQVTFATANLFRYVEEASAKRRAIEDLPSNDHTQIETKNRLHAEAEAATAKVKALADALIAFELRGLDGDAYEEQRVEEAEKVQLLMKRDADASSKSPISNQQSVLAAAARDSLRGRRPFHWGAEFPEVFVHGGFEVMVGNPPFMGGSFITGELGKDYREHIVRQIAAEKRGLTDLCAYFFLHGTQLLKQGGTLGMLATSTIAQGDTREVGLEQICSSGCSIYQANSGLKWPGSANLEVACVLITRADWHGQHKLDDLPVSGISSFLRPVSTQTGKPFELAVNRDKSFNGTKVYGQGFVLEKIEAELLIQKEARNRKVVFPYLIGDDINNQPDHSPSRWAISFFDWPLNHESAPKEYDGPVAADYPDCLAIIEERVKPERTRKDDKGEYVLRHPMPATWWIHGEKRPKLYSTIRRSFQKVLVRALTSKHHAFIFAPVGWIFDQSTPVVASDCFGMFSILQSDIHYKWSLEYGNKLETRPQYTTSDCFETFPFPQSASSLAAIGCQYYKWREETQSNKNEGLTNLYNRFHERGEQSADIARLRAVHVEMDQAVAAAYGWSDLDLGHGFHATKQGVRYTISESARGTVLDRLLQLNHQRYAEEVKAGLHGKGVKKVASKNKKTDATALQVELLKPPQGELSL